MNSSCGDCLQYWSWFRVRNLLAPHNFSYSVSPQQRCAEQSVIPVYELEEIIDSMIAVTFYQTSMSLESELCISWKRCKEGNNPRERELAPKVPSNSVVKCYVRHQCLFWGHTLFLAYRSCLWTLWIWSCHVIRTGQYTSTTTCSGIHQCYSST